MKYVVVKQMKPNTLAGHWQNQFFICYKCEKVWCAECYGGLIGKGAKKAYKGGKKGKRYIKCPECGNKDVVMVRKPGKLTFDQVKEKGVRQQNKPVEQPSQRDVNIRVSVEQDNAKFCNSCGGKIKSTAVFCEFCGQKQ